MNSFCQECGLDADFYCELLEAYLCRGCCEHFDDDMGCALNDVAPGEHGEWYDCSYRVEGQDV